MAAGLRPDGELDEEIGTMVKGPRSIWPQTAAFVSMLAIIGLQVSPPAAVLAQEAETATEVGVLEARDGLPECEVVDPGAVPAEEAASTYAITSEESVARYIVMEELADIGANEVVGETNAIIGHILFDENGAPLACSRFDVDLRTLETDQARRDNFLRENTLQTDTYPLATFVVRDVEGLDEALPEGEETTITLIGDLTVRDMTKLAAWEATVTRDGDTLTGTAMTTFTFADFEIEKPIIGPVVGIDDEVTLEIDLVAAPAA